MGILCFRTLQGTDGGLPGAGPPTHTPGLAEDFPGQARHPRWGLARDFPGQARHPRRGLAKQLPQGPGGGYPRGRPDTLPRARRRICPGKPDTPPGAWRRISPGRPDSPGPCLRGLASCKPVENPCYQLNTQLNTQLKTDVVGLRAHRTFLKILCKILISRKENAPEV